MEIKKIEDHKLKLLYIDYLETNSHIFLKGKIICG